MVNQHNDLPSQEFLADHWLTFLRTGALREHTGAAIRIFTAGVVEALAEEAIHAVSPEVRCVWATGNPIRPSEALLCYESRGGPDDSSEQSRLRAPFGHTLTRTSALMVNQHTLISQLGILADHWLISCARVRSAHGRGSSNFHSWGCRGPSRLNFCQSVCRKKGLISQTLW